MITEYQERILAAGALLVWGEWQARLGQQSSKAHKMGGKINILN